MDFHKTQLPDSFRAFWNAFTGLAVKFGYEQVLKNLVKTL